jgi:hypothetical protein
VLLLLSAAQITLYMKMERKKTDAIFQEIIIFIFIALRRVIFLKMETVYSTETPV